VKQALADALENRGYTTLTPVQEAVTDPKLGHADLLVSAQTGSGKTVGFGLAIAPTLLGDAEAFERATKPLALVIAPTRELALQVKRELDWLYAKAGAIVTSCVGGMDMRSERRTLDRGAHIVVATPGRLRDHIMRGSLKMDNLRAVILDEADEMLDLGFRDDLEFILGEAPDARRTLLFSATVPRSIESLARNYQTDAVRIVTTSQHSQHADIEYRAMQVSARDGENAIINVLRYYEAPNALVFCNTRAMVNRLTTRFSNRGFSVVALSGELTQNERSHALQAMRDGRARVCVATDVAARGIDLPKLELVIHADLPSNGETLLHRSGRTGRAGRKGVSVLITPPKARRKAQSLLRAAKVTAEWGDAPSAADILLRDQERLQADPTWQQPLSESEQAAAKKLTDAYSGEQIAAAFLRLHNARLSAPEELAPSGGDGAPKPRAPFGASVWFSITGGHAARAEPRRLLPMLCKAGGLAKEDIGAIRIQHEESFVEIRKDAVQGFLKNIGKNMRVEGGASITQLDTPPAIAKSPKPGFSARKSKGGGKYEKGGNGGYENKKSATKGAPPAPIDTAPIDWNDDPVPRNRKPKPGGKGDKPTKPSGAGKRGKPGAKGAPAIGKPNSKKNKARRAKAAALAKAKGKGTRK